MYEIFTVREPCSDKYKRLDEFGEQVKFTYKKKSRFTTTCGASITVLIYVLLAYYTTDGLLRFFRNEI